jgi:hypothetical protein
MNGLDGRCGFAERTLAVRKTGLDRGADRFSPQDLDTWQRDGALTIANFFTAEEVAAVQADFAKLFAGAGAAQARNDKAKGQLGVFDIDQFKNTQNAPFYCSPALNLIGVHEALIALAKAALRTDAVEVYQCHAWAKFTGEADYDQTFHCDYLNHTLGVPSEDAAQNALPILCYFSDTTDAHGAMHYVTRPDSYAFCRPGDPAEADPDFQAKAEGYFLEHARSSASPAGSITPFGIDIYHRGTNLTAPHGHRYAVMVCYKRAGDDSIGHTAWPPTFSRPWHNIFNNGTPEQIACFGIKRPGDRFWTETTIARMQQRYPGWNAAPYREAMLGAGC